MRPSVTATNQRDYFDAYIRLFRLCPIGSYLDEGYSAITGFDELLDNGIVFVNEYGTVMPSVPQDIGRLAIGIFGIGYFNRTFYNSFDEVTRRSVYELYRDQIAHYMNTYGREAMGYDSVPMVPGDAVDLSGIATSDIRNGDGKVTVIKMMSRIDLIVQLNEFLATVAAPSPYIISLVKNVIEDCTLPADSIKSYELSVIQHGRLGTQPKAYAERLRMVLYLITGETLLIKSEAKRKGILASIELGKSLNKDGIAQATKMVREFDVEGMATIFLRYKPLFLTLKKLNGCAPVINRIRRAAKFYHTPENFDVMKNFYHPDLTMTSAMHIARRASNRELVKLMNALSASVIGETDEGMSPRIFTIRNGKTYVAEPGKTLSDEAKRLKAAKVGLVAGELVDRLREVYSGTTFLIPSHIDYAVPTSEKQFVGVYPFGTSIHPDHDGGKVQPFTVGIHWENQDKCRVDLDLHMNSVTEHFGWNGGYCGGDNAVIYSGDITDAPAPEGATEAFYFDPNAGTFTLSVSKYCGGDKPVDFKFFVNSADKDDVAAASRSRYDNSFRGKGANAIFNGHDMLAPVIPMVVGDKGDDEYSVASENLGIFHEGIFYFFGGEMNAGCVPRANYENFIKGIIPQITSKLSLSAVLATAGANVISQADFDLMTEEEQAKVIDLSPECLDLTTLMQIVDVTL